VIARDRYTVVVTLKHPDASWRYEVVSGAPIFEKKFQQEHKTTMGQPGVFIMGTGPWKFDSFNPSTGMELSANPNWWAGKVPIQHISIKFFADETSMDIAYRAGSLDVVGPRDGRAFEKTAGTKVTASAPSGGIGYWCMNVNIAPWNDVHVRRAVAYAINRSDFVTAYGGFATPVSTLIPADDLTSIASTAQVDALLKTVPQYPFSLAKARAELAKSAYPHGFTATTDTPDYAIYPNMNEVISGELAKIGITLKVNSVDIGKWVTDYFGPKTYGSNFVTWFSSTPDPSAHTTEILGSKNVGNAAGYTPPAVDALLKQGISTLNVPKRLAIYGKLMRRLATDMPYVPLYEETANIAIVPKYRLQHKFSRFTTWALDIRPK
jgi:peptide/nickel transport system substrate-binding protein